MIRRYGLGLLLAVCVGQGMWAAAAPAPAPSATAEWRLPRGIHYVSDYEEAQRIQMDERQFPSIFIIDNGRNKPSQKMGWKDLVISSGFRSVTAVPESFASHFGATLGQNCAEMLLLKLISLFKKPQQPKEVDQNEHDMQFAMLLQDIQAKRQGQLTQEGKAIENLRKQLESYTATTPHEQKTREGLQMVYKNLVEQHAVNMVNFLLAPQEQNQNTPSDVEKRTAPIKADATKN